MNADERVNHFVEVTAGMTDDEFMRFVKVYCRLVGIPFDDISSLINELDGVVINDAQLPG